MLSQPHPFLALYYYKSAGSNLKAFFFSRHCKEISILCSRPCALFVKQEPAELGEASNQGIMYQHPEEEEQYNSRKLYDSILFESW